MDTEDISFAQDKNEFSFKPKEEDVLKRTHEGESLPKDEDSFEESPLSFLSGKTISLILGILVIALLVPFLIFSFSRSKSKNTASNNQVSSSNSISPTPVNKQASKTNHPTTTTFVQNTTKGGLPLGGSMAQTLGTQVYTDPVFGYSVTIPGNWETFKSAGTGNAYQIAFHPQGSPDIPFTIAGQSGVSENDWINAAFGTDYPRENANVAGRNALLVRHPNYLSYYTHDRTYTYEISQALANQMYLPTINSMLSSLKFSK